ncbi:MAG: hypothetical protein WC249_00160 [Patescibacteria group bacterium]
MSKNKLNNIKKNQSLNSFLRSDFFTILLFSALFFGILVSLNFKASYEQQFSLLANSFGHGRLYFIDQLTSYSDAVKYQGLFYWPLGPWPAVLLTPFVWLFNQVGLFFYQGYLSFFLVILIFLLVYKISLKFNYNFIDSWYLAYAFCLASPFLGTAIFSYSWYFAQVVAVFFTFWALWEFFNRRRYLLLGFIFGILFLTRITAGLGIIFLLLSLFFSNLNRTDKIKELFRLILPVLLAFILLGMYNFFRFDNIYDQGYSRQILIESLSQARSYGLISLYHLPGNLYYLFLSAPWPVFRDNISHVLKFPFIRVDFWGLGLFFTSPYLLSLFFRRIRGNLSWFLLISASVIAIPILLYYGIGFKQFGYRYALDFLPYIFLLFLITYRQEKRRLSVGLKILIIISSVFNLYLTIHF